MYPQFKEAARIRGRRGGMGDVSSKIREEKVWKL